MRRLTVLFVLLLPAWSEGAPAQATQDSSAARTRARLCYRARPRPACSAFVLTNFGSYVVLGSDETGDTPLRGVADWGLMVNVGTGTRLAPQSSPVWTSLGSRSGLPPATAAGSRPQDRSRWPWARRW